MWTRSKVYALMMAHTILLLVFLPPRIAAAGEQHFVVKPDDYGGRGLFDIRLKKGDLIKYTLWERDFDHLVHIDEYQRTEYAVGNFVGDSADQYRGFLVDPPPSARGPGTRANCVDYSPS